MPGKCPLCGQSLPHALNHDELQLRIQKLSSPALTAEKKKLKEDYDIRLETALQKNQQAAERQFQHQLNEAKQRAKINAERETKKQLSDAKKRATDAETRARQEINRIKKEVDSQYKNEIARLQNERDKDRLRYEANQAQSKKEFDDALRKMEKRSGEELGEEAERDLCAELKSAFPGDRIERINRGTKGADVLHEVKESGKIIGRIIYESKNTLTWLNEFIVQAKKYRTQYETPHVLVVTRVFPKKQKWFCVEKGIPLVGPSMAVPLATIIREGIVALAKLRLSGNSHDEKSIELYQYIVGDKFCTRFRELADGIEALRVQQQNERRWHQNAWEAESKICERIASRHSEVEAHISAICSGSFSLEVKKLAARSETLQGGISTIHRTERAR